MTLNAAISRLKGKSELTAEDALTLRRVVFADDARVDPIEADALFDINADATNPSQPWRDLFCEAITDFVVRQQAPTGYVSEAQADWLIQACTRRNRLREDELDALVHVLEAADHSPTRLTDFILSSLKSLALWRIEHQGRLSASDIARLKRLIYATGGAGNVGITRPEAEALLDINDALRNAVVEGAWQALFVPAVASSILVESTWSPDASRAQAFEKWVSDLEIKPFGRPADTRTMGEGIRDGFAALTSWNFDNRAWDEQFEARARAQAVSEEVTADEAGWLFDRLGRDGRFDDNEKALIAFIRENAGSLSPSFARRFTEVARLADS